MDERLQRLAASIGPFLLLSVAGVLLYQLISNDFLLVPQSFCFFGLPRKIFYFAWAMEAHPIRYLVLATLTALAPLLRQPRTTILAWVIAVTACASALAANGIVLSFGALGSAETCAPAPTDPGPESVKSR